MPWVWTNGNGNSRRRNRTRVNGHTRRAYRNGGYADADERYDASDNGYDEYDGYDDDRPVGNDTGDDWDGNLYDRGGNRVRLTIQTPRDLLPPGGDAPELRGGYIVRGRARF